ncbi:MAG: LuxR C-terminal-related transcriptional regulator [Chloroflexi bacterium]|nr:LuxR C-terminal-related transcriptional regulator [Chloroflexota bacterium]
MNADSLHLSSFIGRQVERAAIRDLLLQTRLLTLAGPGGIGKTRLALQIAVDCEDLFSDGIVFVPLQTVNEASFVVFALSNALGITSIDKSDAYSQLLDYLQNRHMLLVLDNVEHLLDAGWIMADILEKTPHTNIMITSREVLNLREEQIYHVQGLPVDDDAVQLFTARARQVRLDFIPDEADIRDICRILDGVPLAIELAATWVKVLTTGEIIAEIRRNLDFLSTPLKNVPERHRSMRAVFNHSWELLPDTERDVLKRLSVFGSSFTRQAAESVAGASLASLASLVDKSLLRVDGRYSIHELLRQYAGELLDDTERYQTQHQHAAYYHALLCRMGARLKSAEQAAALKEIEVELDHIRSAWEWMVNQRHEDMIWDCLEPLGLYYQMRSRLMEGYELFTRAVRQFEPEESPLLAVLLLLQGWYAQFAETLRPELSIEIVRRAARLIQRFNITGVLPMHMGEMVFQCDDGGFAIVQQSYDYFRERNNQWGMAWCLHNLAHLKSHYEGDDTQAKKLFEEAITAFEAIGDRWGATWSHGALGLMLEEEGDLAAAFEHYRQRLEPCNIVGDLAGTAWTLQQIAQVAMEMGNDDVARHYCYQSLQVAMDVSSMKSVDESIFRFARLHEMTGNYDRAVELLAPFHQNNLKFYYVQQQVDTWLSNLRTRMTPDQYDTAYQLGRAKSLEQLARELLDELSEDKLPAATVLQPLVESLSDRELEVLELVANGLSNQEIAAQLVVSVGTVKKHLNNIFGKLNVSNRTQAAARARDLSLL